MSTTPSEAEQLRQEMEGFISDRRDTKLKKEKDAAKQEQLKSDHEPAVWIASAASRAKHIQIVTHAIKYAHPDARGSSLHSEGNQSAGEGLIGTHSIQGAVKMDAVGNAAALDVFSFLSREVDGKPLWQRAVEKDSALFAALPGGEEEKQAWIESFASIVGSKGKPASHALAKQLYWPLPDGGYHLLGPLFPSSLAHRAWEILKEGRFSKSAKAAHKARWENKPHTDGYRVWPGLTIQKFGGDNSQNISSFNSQRHGEAWLLSSAPPAWSSQRLRPPFRVDNVFQRLEQAGEVENKLLELGQYLLKVQDVNNVRIRQERARRVEEIIDDVLQYAVAVRTLPGGWSADPACRLPKSQCLWLDPGRGREDAAFAAAVADMDWVAEVARSFGIWINGWLKKARLPVGDDAFRAWRDAFADSLREILEGMEA